MRKHLAKKQYKVQGWRVVRTRQNKEDAGQFFFALRPPHLSIGWSLYRSYGDHQARYVNLVVAKRENFAPAGSKAKKLQVDSKGVWWWCITLRITAFFFFKFCPSSGILENRKHNVSETGSVSVHRWRGEATYSLGPLDRANLNHWTRLRLDLSKGSNWVDAPPPTPEDGKQIYFPKRFFFLLVSKSTGRWTKSRNPAIPISPANKVI
jgi:hypothetical protein